jgi:hypothetical protein
MKRRSLVLLTSSQLLREVQGIQTVLGLIEKETMGEMDREYRK